MHMYVHVRTCSYAICMRRAAFAYVRVYAYAQAHAYACAHAQVLTGPYDAQCDLWSCGVSSKY